MITEYEKTKAIEQRGNLASILINNTEGALFYKIISNFIAKAYPLKDIRFDESVLKNKREMENNLSEMIEYMVMIAAEDIQNKVYTTGQLSKYFGVSITSINNWINEGRFTGVERVVRNKQARIPENALWRSASGELIPVKEIIETWEKHYAKTQDVSRDDEKRILKDEIKFFEDKYGGPYETTLKIREKKTDASLRDQEEWEYLLKRLGE